MRIGIIGGGFTGTMLSVNLLRSVSPNRDISGLDKADLDIVLIEGQHAFGRGVAYDSLNPDHLLNVRAGNMSAYEDDPSHFLRWLWARDDAAFASIPPSGHGFVPRRIYGDYIASVLKTAMAERPRGVTISRVRQVATALHHGRRLIVTLGDGRRLYLDRVVLCLGNFPPTHPAGLSPDIAPAERVISNSWDEHQLRRIPATDPVLVLGSGLTMVDVVQSLMRQAHRGAIQVISRHGFIPLRHEAGRKYEVSLPGGRLLPVLQFIRREVRAAASKGYNWRDVVDALRPAVTGLWQGFSLADRRQFLRHLRPYWEIHRHRLAPQVADDLDRWRQSGQLTVKGGRIGQVSWTGDGFDVQVTGRGEHSPARVAAARIINCAGPESDYRQISHPLVREMMDRRIVRPDPLHLGIDVTTDNAVIDGEGQPSPKIFAVGPPTKGAFWEITAVPDIRTACARVARTLLAVTPSPAPDRGPQ